LTLKPSKGKKKKKKVERRKSQKRKKRTESFSSTIPSVHERPKGKGGRRKN